MSDSGIEILLSSVGDYKELTVEIYYNGKFIALLNQDEGVNNLKIEFRGTVVAEDMVLRKIDLATFEKGLELAKQRIRS